MGIKRYVLLSFIYIFAVGLYVYSFNGDNYTLQIYTLSLTLPVALWIVMPVVVFFIASISHLAYYSFKDFFYRRALKKDLDTYVKVAKKIILGEKSSLKFKTDLFKLPSFIIKTLNYTNKADVQDLDNEELKECYNLVDNIKAGKYEDLKKFKLSADNQLFIINEENRLKIEPKYAYTILKSCDNLNSELCQKSYNEILNIGTFSEIKKYKFPIDKDIFRRMMERYLDEEDEFDMDIKSIKDMLETFNATSEDYLELAQEIKVKLTPDELIDLFRTLFNEKGSIAANAYLYTLFDLEMIDKVREILENSEEEDYLKFKTLLFLRDHGKNIDTIKYLREC